MKTEKKRNLKGSVLFTVVSVLAIMIIFMTCTLAMATSANKRARKSFASSQSSYTARTAIDSILAAVGTDKNFSKAIRTLTQGQEMHVVVDINNPSMGTVDNATIKFVGTKKVYDPAPEVKSWVTRNLYKITADITIGGETTTISSNVLQDPPQPPAEGGAGAAFLTYGSGLDVGTFTCTWGGTYIGMGKWQDIAYSGFAEDGMYSMLVNRDYLTNKNYKFQNDNNTETPLVINGNFDVVNEVGMYYAYQSSGKSNPGVQVWGDLTMTNNKFSARISDQIKDNIDTSNFISIPYLYVDGDIKTSVETKFGFANQTTGSGDDVKCVPFNVFCGAIYSAKESGGSMFAKESATTVYGDLYCMDAERTSVIINNETALYKWASSTINGTSEGGGSIYSKGNVILVGDNMVIPGNIYTEGNLIIEAGNITVKGDIVCGGKIAINNGAKLTVAGGKTAYVDKITKYNSFKPGSGSVKTVDDVKNLYEEIKETEARIPTTGLKIKHTEYWTEDVNKWLYPKDMDNIRTVAGLDPSLTDDKSTIDFHGREIDEDTWKSIESYFGTWGEPKEHITGYREKSSNKVISVAEYDAQITQAQKDMTAALATYRESYVLEGEADGGSLTSGTTKKLEEFYKTGKKTIYPEYAERNILMGLTYPIKGIENRVVPFPREIDFNVLPTFTQAVLETQNMTVKQSCTLTGTFKKSVTIKAPKKDDPPIYVRLLSEPAAPIYFENTIQTDAEGKKTVLNDTRIIVDESNGGEVYFVLEGKAWDKATNYNFDADNSTTKLLKTIVDWMQDFALEASQADPVAAGEAPNMDTIADKTISGGETISLDGAATGTTGFKLLGGLDGETITIVPPANDTIWIVLPDNFKTTNGSKIICDDTNGGKIKFYIAGKVTLDQTQVVAKSFEDKMNNNSYVYIWGHGEKKNEILNKPVVIDGKTIPTATDDNTLTPPAVWVYSAPTGAELNGSNGFFLTGYIKAINMPFNVPTAYDDKSGWINKIIYDGIPLGKVSPSIRRTCVVGMLDVKSCDAGNDWSLLYVDNSKSGNNTVTDAEGKHQYASVEYFAYAN